MGVKKRNFFADRENKAHWCEQPVILYGVNVARWGSRALWFPGLSWLVITVCDPMAGIWSLIANTFPQYILNLSYSLDHKELTYPSLLALIAQLATLLITPLHSIVNNDISHVSKLEQPWVVSHDRRARR